MKLKRIAARGAAVAALAAAGTLIAAGSAFAGTVDVYTTDGNPGGLAEYNNSTAVFTVCDIQADGYSVYGVWSWGSSTYSESATSGNGTCVSEYTPNLTTGAKYGIDVCLHKSGALSYCKLESFTE